MTGCWLGRITKVASEAAPIGELYAPTEEPSAMVHKMSFVEPLIEIEPQMVGHILALAPFTHERYKELERITG
jgi:hypothetical protein